MRGLIISSIIFGMIAFANLSFAAETSKSAETQQKIQSIQQLFKGEIVKMENTYKLKTDSLSYSINGPVPTEMLGKKVQVTGQLSEDRTTIKVTKIEVM